MPRGLLLSLALSTTLYLSACAPAFSGKDPANLDEFATLQTIDVGNYKLAYTEAGLPGQPLVIFIHGTPGSWHAFEAFLQAPELVDQFHMIAVDRLGFGRSAESGVQADFDVQTKALAHLFCKNRSALKTILVGHSLGGTIAGYMTMQYPNQVGGTLILSSPLDPELAELRWYNRAADLWGIRHVLPADLMIANDEMKVVQPTLNKMRSKWGSITQPITIFQGAKDRLVDAGHADFAEAQIQAKKLSIKRFPDHGHFIIWEEPHLVIDAILDLSTKNELSPTTSVQQPNNINSSSC